MKHIYQPNTGAYSLTLVISYTAMHVVIDFFVKIFGAFVILENYSSEGGLKRWGWTQIFCHIAFV